MRERSAGEKGRRGDSERVELEWGPNNQDVSMWRRGPSFHAYGTCPALMMMMMMTTDFIGSLKCSRTLGILNMCHFIESHHPVKKGLLPTFHRWHH